MERKVNIGDKARDPITGVSGTVCAYLESLDVPDQVRIDYADSTGRHAESWFVASRVEVTEKGL